MDNDIRIYATGSAFEDGVFDLRSLETVLSSYRSIFDRLVAVQLGRKQLPDKAKKQLNYDVRINNGSLEVLLDFVFQNEEVLAVLAYDGGYQLSNVLVKLFRDAVDLRKAASDFIEKGLKFDIKITNSFNFGSNNVHVNIEDSEILIPDPKILFAAQTTKYPTDKLISQVDGNLIKKVDLYSREKEFTLDEGDRNILGREKEMLTATLKIVGRLDMVAFSSHKGVIISDGESFPVTWDENIRSKMQKIADIEGIVFTVQPVIDHKRLNKEAIGFHVLNCDNSQKSMKFD